MIQEAWHDLIVDNPMLVEVTRFRRRYFSFSTGNSLNTVVFGLCLVCYATLVLVVAENREAISPIGIIFFQMAVLTVFAPMVLYNAIAGERERRSWDLLLAAPITRSQIVVGKFIGAMAALGITLVLFLVPVVITLLSFEQAHFMTTLAAEFISLSFVAVVCALTILFSARVKRGLMALGTTLGLLICGLVVIPALVGSGGGPMLDVTLFLHPFYVLQKLMEVDRQSHLIVVTGPLNDLVNPYLWGLPQILTYLALALILIIWAANTLNFAENEVKFLPQGHNDA